MALINEHLKEDCDNGICSICGEEDAVIYWSGAKGLAFCGDCIENILPCVLGDYIFYKIYGTHEASRTKIREYRDYRTIINEFNSEVYENLLTHLGIRLKNHVKDKAKLENKIFKIEEENGE